MEFIAAAFAFGLSAGLSPGPFMLLVLAESLRNGWRSGALAALAPLISDAPVIILSLLALGSLPPSAFAVMEGAGGIFMLYLGYQTARSGMGPDAGTGIAGTGGSPDAAGLPQPAPGAGRNSAGPAALGPLWRGVAVNLLNPAPWLFWFTAGGTVLHRALASGWASSLAFLFIFYCLLVGSKVALAVLAGRQTPGGRTHRALLFGSGLALAGLGIRALYLSGSHLLG